MNKKRITWIELLRIAACIGVIGIHAGSQHFRDTALDSGVWRVSNFYHGIFRFAVAVFVMISGTLYLDSKRNWSLKKLWRKNILQIAAAYAFWQFFMQYTDCGFRKYGRSGPVFKEGPDLLQQFLLSFMVSSDAGRASGRDAASVGDRKL